MSEPPRNALTIALTGATGFVGGRLLDTAVAAAIPVRALTRQRQPDRPGVTWVRGALDDAEALNFLCRDVDAVLHIAGVVNAPGRDGFQRGNVAGTLAMVEAAKAQGVPRFVHVSSLAATQPQLSHYGESKAQAERIVAASGLDWTMVRPPWVYGPGDRDTLDLFKSAKLGVIPLPPNRNARISVIHVDDLVRLLIGLLAPDEELTTQIFECDDGREHGWTHADFARAVGRAMGRRVAPLGTPRLLLQLGAASDRLIRRGRAKLTPDRVAYFCHDNWRIDPARRPPAALWRPAIATDDGLQATARWYRDNDWL